jgi:uncharacterized membrane protein
MKKISRRILRLFLQGLLSLLPLLITIWVVTFFFTIVERALDNVIIFIPREYRDINAIVWIVEASTAVGVFCGILAFGILIRTIFGKAIVNGLNALLDTIPGLNAVYRTTRQVIELFTNKKDKSLMKPVLVEWPSPGIWSIGFLTGEVNEHLSPGGADKFFTVFIPKTPNPATGFVVILPPDKIRQVQISTEDAFKLVLTGGMAKT